MRPGVLDWVRLELYVYILGFRSKKRRYCMYFTARLCWWCVQIRGRAESSKFDRGGHVCKYIRLYKRLSPELLCSHACGQSEMGRTLLAIPFLSAFQPIARRAAAAPKVARHITLGHHQRELLRLRLLPRLLARHRLSATTNRYRLY